MYVLFVRACVCAYTQKVPTVIFVPTRPPDSQTTWSLLCYRDISHWPSGSRSVTRTSHIDPAGPALSPGHLTLTQQSGRVLTRCPLAMKALSLLTEGTKEPNVCPSLSSSSVADSERFLSTGDWWLLPEFLWPIGSADRFKQSLLLMYTPFISLETQYCGSVHFFLLKIITKNT